jgi:hypothetical protein
MRQWMSRSSTAMMPLAPRRVVLVGPTQVLQNRRKEFFPREFCKGVGVLELAGAQWAREFHRRAEIPCGATARGVGHAQAFNNGR